MAHAHSAEPGAGSPSGPKPLDRVRAAIRLRHFSRRTEDSYVASIRRFILFQGKRHPSELGGKEVAAFLSHLALRRHVGASTQNQALSALVFLYRHVLGRELDVLDGLICARRPSRLPVVLTRDEVAALLAQLGGAMWVIAALLYGSELRLSECLDLRVKDIDVEANQVMVRGGKGGKDRVTPLPAVVKAPLARHLERVRAQHGRDLARGLGRVMLPDAIAVKYPHAATSWSWQFVFPAARVCWDERYGPPSRFRLHESAVQRAIAEAVRCAGLTKRVTPHSLRHYLPFLTMSRPAVPASCARHTCDAIAT